MKSIFSKLPNDIVKNILLYDEHFAMRKGQIVSIIPKTDCRYNLLNHITLKPDQVINDNAGMRCKYYFQNLHNYKGRRKNNADLFEMRLTEKDDGTHYSIWIGKQYPKSVACNKKQIYYVENQSEYHWIYTEYEYLRK